MLKKARLSALLTLFFISLASADDFGLNSGNFNIKERLSAVEAPLPQAQAPEPAFSKSTVKEWTIMIFMNGKNSIESFALKDIN